MKTRRFPLLQILWILLGILSASFGLKGFLLPSHFIDGGVTGMSMLLAQVLGWPLPVSLVLLNVPFVVLGYRQIGPRFAWTGTAAIAGLAVCLLTLSFPAVTSDKLLTAVFGGFFLGSGIGLAIRGGAVLDGTEIAALLVSRATHMLRVGDIILLMNVIIFSAALVTLGTEPALYSILTYLSASKTIDFWVHGIEEYTAITIISKQHEAIRQAIIQQLNRSVTIYHGQRGKSLTPQPILSCVVTRLEIGRVKNLATELDDQAFILCHSISDVEGGVIKKLALK